MKTKKIMFLTGTRADFGKIKSLIQASSEIREVEYNIFITGMHLLKKYGNTHKEVQDVFCNTYEFINQYVDESMDMVLSNTIAGLSRYIHENKPDMIVIHGDRVEALAGAIVGSINNILVAHVEGGERSGTIDELIRHAVTKMSHIHLVSNEEAKQRIIQMGENSNSVFIIGSPDMDVMNSNNLPSIKEVRERYEIKFDAFHIVLFHPVTTEINQLEQYAKNLVDALIESKHNYVIIYPNNDMGSSIILKEYERLKFLSNFKLFPSIRFEYFLTLMKFSKSVIGNSSAGIREAPFYGIPSINIGTRQNMRSIERSIVDIGYEKEEIKRAIQNVETLKVKKSNKFGVGNSADEFKKILQDNRIWNISKQKVFIDI